jgi:hypothetical protein
LGFSARAGNGAVRDVPHPLEDTSGEQIGERAAVMVASQERGGRAARVDRGARPRLGWRTMRRRSAALLALLAASCSSDPEPAPRAEEPLLAPPPAGEGFQLAMTGIVAQPGEEVWRCLVYPIPVEQTANVQWVRFLQNEGMHHMTISAPGFFRSSLAYGESDCRDLYGDSAFMEDAVVIFGGAGTAAADMHLPDGVVAAIPSTIDVIHEVHYVNVSDEPVELYSYINAYTIAPELVQERIYGGSVRDENIAIPPKSEHSEWSRCVFDQDVEIHFLASHTHGLGKQFTIRTFDGTSVGDQVYQNDDLQTPAIKQYDPPLKVPAGQGFEWTCLWNNNTDRAITYGLNSTDEMCNMAVVFTPFDLSLECKVVETSDGVVPE